MKFLKALLPAVRVKSIQQFINLLKTHGASNVLAQCTMKVQDRVNLGSIGATGRFLYVLVLNARGSDGRRLTTAIEVARRDGSERGFADHEERSRSNTIAYLETERITDLLKKAGFDVQLFAPDGNPFPDEVWSGIHADASRLGLI